MQKQANYSPIKVDSQLISAGNKEVEARLPHREFTKPSGEKEAELKPESGLEKLSEKEVVEVIPELPEIDKELQNEGVELVDHDTIFVANRNVDLPMPLEKVDQGLKKPLTSGWRWIAELTRYILAKLGIKIKKDGQKFKLIEQH
jgi:hypothetical protein